MLKKRQFHDNESKAFWKSITNNVPDTYFLSVISKI